MSKLTIDFRMHNASGIGTYIKNIVPFLFDRFDITLLGNYKEIQKYSWSKKVKVVECSSNIYSIKEHFELAVKVPACDLFWSPHYNIPLLPIKAKKRIVTMHDVYHLAFYEKLNIKQKIYARFMINQALIRSDIILTPSKFSCNEIKKLTNKKNIEIVYNAVDLNLFRIINEKSRLNLVKEKYNLPNKFLLFVGNVKPHKNLKRLLLAISDTDIDIVIVGKKDGLITADKEIVNIIEKNALITRVFFTGYVDDYDLPAIYNLAKLFVFVSLYEGFGIPPLEAQACGCPVICSDAASLPEVGGLDSVIYCDPYSIEDIKRKIELVFNDVSLQDDLRIKGFENIKRFSWKVSAINTANIISMLNE